MNEHLKRGNLLWEGSRMFLPEHKQSLLERKRHKQKLQKPILDSDKLEEMNQTLCTAMEFTQDITVSCFQDGEIVTCSGKICRYEEFEKTVWIKEDAGKLCKLRLDQVLDIFL
ncbi:YolD-like family protein [Bacillus mojavensis]|uniref:YolD-like family protein n=1 Tax=Bacillus mojavensis TaxID=72360 RepID=A0AAP3G138_BACMO|nr:YolD-like family protein [Bacillus mojavensis]MCY8104221.1 YolD-like family protein [Bacillus mojavensis]MCY8480395.1 YolD-like family protein [Bacillus mojavensis]MCY8509407.1 YolD-like family protein [Bacillus mojavensis]